MNALENNTHTSVAIGSASDVAPGDMIAGHLPDGTRVAIYNVEGQLYATDDLCTHGNASLVDEESLEGCTIECGLHLGTFDVRTGKVLGAPCTKALRTYPVRNDSGTVWIDVAAG